MMTQFVRAMAGAAMIAGMASVPAAAEKPERVYGQPAAINFAGNGGIRDWHAEDNRSIYIRDRTGRWYFATLSGPCPTLAGRQTVHFETDALGRFDTFSSIHTDWGSCQVESLVTSPAPAAKGGPDAD